MYVSIYMHTYMYWLKYLQIYAYKCIRIYSLQINHFHDVLLPRELETIFGNHIHTKEMDIHMYMCTYTYL